MVELLNQKVVEALILEKQAVGKIGLWPNFQAVRQSRLLFSPRNLEYDNSLPGRR
ncbi:hypothetical protein LCGC14_1699850 [marine sediment metagenome]|uniref:Uncharacterized protein n=1 Tax=marine sediment metagenome TaxID=412755 RepID=A0A0F9HIY0_9ZZZZ